MRAEYRKRVGARHPCSRISRPVASGSGSCCRRAAGRPRTPGSRPPARRGRHRANPGHRGVARHVLIREQSVLPRAGRRSAGSPRMFMIAGPGLTDEQGREDAEHHRDEHLDRRLLACSWASWRRLMRISSAWPTQRETDRHAELVGLDDGHHERPESGRCIARPAARMASGDRARPGSRQHPGEFHPDSQPGTG